MNNKGTENIRTKKIEILLFLVTVLFAGCSVENDNVFKAEEVTVLDSMDYIIISASLKWFLRDFENSSFDFDPEYYGNDKTEELFISDSTIFDPISEGGIKMHQAFDSTDNYITRGLSRMNRKNYSIDNSRINSFVTRKLEGEEKKLMDHMNYRELYARYPKAWGIVHFSKPHYDITTKRAVIFLEYHKGGNFGKTEYMWLLNDGNGWVPYDEIQLWIN